MFTHDQVESLLSCTARLAGAKACTVTTEKGDGLQYGSFMLDFPEDEIETLKIAFESSVTSFSSETTLLMTRGVRHHIQGEMQEARARHVANQWAEAMQGGSYDHNDKEKGRIRRAVKHVLEDRYDDRGEFVCTTVVDPDWLEKLKHDTRTLPEPWRDPAEEWPEGNQDIRVAVMREMRGGSTSRHATNAVVYSNRMIDADLSVPASFHAGCKVSEQGTCYLDAWMPLPSHPLDDRREAGRRRFDAGDEGLREYLASLDDEFSEDRG